MDINEINENDVLCVKMRYVDEEIICYVKDTYKHSNDLLVQPIEGCNEIKRLQLSQQFVNIDDVYEKLGILDTFEVECPEYFL